MCEYCGCQQISTIADLTREHDDLVTQMSIARNHLSADRTDETAAVCRDMLDVLGLHTQVEEEGLFPLLTDEFPDHVLGLRAEHTRIEGVLSEAADHTPTDPSWPDRLLATFHLLREHILKEQDGMFPAALIALDGQQWEQVEAVRSRAEREIAAGGHDRDPAQQPQRPSGT
jgi:hemerythrin-like domain-containing protein